MRALPILVAANLTLAIADGCESGVRIWMEEDLRALGAIADATKAAPDSVSSLKQLGIPKGRLEQDGTIIEFVGLESERRWPRYALLKASTPHQPILWVVFRTSANAWQHVGTLERSIDEASRQAGLLSHDELDWLVLYDSSDDGAEFELVFLSGDHLVSSLRAGKSCSHTLEDEKYHVSLASREPEIEDTWRGMELVLPVWLTFVATTEGGGVTAEHRISRLRYAWDSFSGTFSPIQRQSDMPPADLEKTCRGIKAGAKEITNRAYWRPI